MFYIVKIHVFQCNKQLHRRERSRHILALFVAVISIVLAVTKSITFVQKVLVKCVPWYFITLKATSGDFYRPIHQQDL